VFENLKIEWKWLAFAMFLWLASFLILILGRSSENLEATNKQLSQELMRANSQFTSYVYDNDIINSKIANNSYNFQEFESFTDEDFTLLIFNNEELVFWNNLKTDIKGSDVSKWKSGEIYKLDNGFYYFVKSVPKNVTEAYRNIDVVGLYWLKDDYSIENQFLENNTNSDFPIPENLVLTSQLPEHLQPNQYLTLNEASKNTKAVFAYFDKQLSSSRKYVYVVLLQLVALALFFHFAYQLFRVNFNENHNKWKGFLGYSIFCIIMIALVFLSNFPVQLSTLRLFSLPLFKGGTVITVGKVALFIGVFFSWFWYFLRELNLKITHEFDETKKLLIHTASTFIYTIIIWGFACILIGLVKNPETSFAFSEIFNINLFIVVGLFSLIAIIVIATLVGRFVAHFNTSIQLEFFVRLVSVVLALFFFAVLNFIFPLSNVWIFVTVIALFTCFIIPVIGWPLIRELNLQTIIISLVLLSFIASIFIKIIENDSEEDRRVDYAVELSKEGDQITPILVENIIENIKSDNNLNSFFQIPFLPKAELYKRIDAKHLGEFYKKKFDIETFLFEVNGQCINKGSKLQNLNDLNIYINAYGTQTESKSIYIIDAPDDKTHFLAHIPIKSNGKTVGDVCLKLYPLESKTNVSNVPELVMGEQYATSNLTNSYNYAIYNEELLVNSKGDYPYSRNRRLFYDDELTDSLTFKKFNGYSHLFFLPNLDKMIVVSKPLNSLLYFLSLFSFIFFLLLVVVMLFVIIRSLFSINPNKNLAVDLFYSTLRKRVNTTLFITILFSFLLIGLITSWYFINQAGNDHLQKLSLKRNELSLIMEDYLADNARGGIDKLKNDFQIQSYLDDLAEIHSIDINLFDLDGELVASSRPLIYEKGIVPEQMDPDAFQTLDKLEQTIFTQHEKTGKLEYLSSYGTLRNNFGKSIGYINLPYYASQKSVQNNLSNFLVTILNSYVILLLLTSFFGLFLSNSITRPLMIIRDRLTKIRLGQRNEKLVWEDDDEIGDLVNQYNNTLEELDASAKMLAESERQFAWQQMAKQVAHEIKNPLTPMKLSIQHLQRANQSNDPKISELVGRMSKTLIEQIDHLAHVASEFSSFAKVPQLEEELLDLLSLLNSVIDLYKESKAVKIVKMFPEETCLVLADKTQLTKVIHNIIKNAIQAITDKDQGIIIISVKNDGNKVLVSFADNGRGIPEDQKDKIFQPNFTTKNTGMGLGLAISRNVIENLNGEIWFESAEGEGTTFYVSLPLKK